MKNKNENLSFFMTPEINDLHKMQQLMGCIEEVEKVFGIEFASGIENDIPLFYSDVEGTDKEVEFLEKYDGAVIDHIFKSKETQQIFNTHEKSCRFDVQYNPNYRYEGVDPFAKPKIIKRGIR